MSVTGCPDGYLHFHNNTCIEESKCPEGYEIFGKECTKKTTSMKYELFDGSIMLIKALRLFGAKPKLKVVQLIMLSILAIVSSYQNTYVPKECLPLKIVIIAFPIVQGDLTEYRELVLVCIICIRCSFLTSMASSLDCLQITRVCFHGSVLREMSVRDSKFK